MNEHLYSVSDLLECSSEIQNYSFSPFHYSCEGNMALKWSSRRKSVLALSYGGIRPSSLNAPLYNRISPYHSALFHPQITERKSKVPSYILPERDSDLTAQWLLLVWGYLLLTETGLPWQACMKEEACSVWTKVAHSPACKNIKNKLTVMALFFNYYKW